MRWIKTWMALRWELRSHARALRGLAMLALIALAAAPRSVEATQHLVRAGEPWERLLAKAEPGDQIILMPGVHRPATLEGLTGTAEQPIVIRSVSPDRPATIEAGAYGLRLIRPRHVRLEHLRITGASIHAVEITGEGAGDQAGDVTLKTLEIEHAPESGSRHAIVLHHVDRVQLVDCRVTGWSGSAVEIVGACEITVQGSVFTGREDSKTEFSGVRVRGGSDRVTVTKCRFERTGDQAVCIGGASKEPEFRTPFPTEAPVGDILEATRVEVSHCTMVGGRSAVAFVGCRDAAVRSCTIYRPRRAVISIRNEQEDERFATAAGCDFDQNLIVWEDGDLTALGHLGENASYESVKLGENLWWTPTWDKQKLTLGPFPGTRLFPQITNVDPRLDEQLHPRVTTAEVYGAAKP